MNYIRNHWLGNQSLLWSFWVNLVGLRIAILFFERFTHPPFTEQSPAAIVATVVFFLVFQLIVYAWQAVGVIRAGDRFQAEWGTYLTVRMTQLGLVFSLFVTLIYVFGAFQSLFENPEAMYKNRFRSLPPLLNEYTLTLTDEATRIHLEGDFKIGITKELSSLLEQNPTVKGIVFSSSGGRVTEGRGVARLIKKNRLDTYVFNICKSACTTAFIAGVTRNLGADGRLGFHQFAVNSRLKTPYIDPQEEQKIDLAFYREQNIDDSFLNKVFNTSHDDIWFPNPEELLVAGVIHRIMAER